MLQLAAVGPVLLVTAPQLVGLPGVAGEELALRYNVQPKVAARQIGGYFVDMDYIAGADRRELAVAAAGFAKEPPAAATVLRLMVLAVLAVQLASVN